VDIDIPFVEVLLVNVLTEELIGGLPERTGLDVLIKFPRPHRMDIKESSTI
jgi:hypothetical protein